ncbi:hypothetical protein AN960_00380 [Bacillus sp. FJAT-25509]|uniref:hypothetical protein n=1 Tax=Bacillus sp. FJAT-25509 TaxID=1712029 RepID=UPI0006F792DB|nr:hypothetical protein [Bacillus sp. FJAT-25509]KQL42453.1 hypothetical protein AN960_00380 [Bacillus sp. FJAT-25509]
MIFNIRFEEWEECYFRKIDIDEVGEYMPPRWVFNFKKEFDEEYEIFSLETKRFPGMAQGIIALKSSQDDCCVYLKSVETADFNKYYNIGKISHGMNHDRVYEGVGYNLVAFACQYSIVQGFEGYMYLVSKTDTIPFYTGLGGDQLYEGSQTIVFQELVGQRLALKHFPGGEIQWLK